MKLKEIRLREFAPIGGAGSQILQSHQVDMLLDDEKALIFARKRSSGEYFVIPMSMVSYMRPEQPIKVIIDAFPTPTPPPVPVVVKEKDIVTAPVDDTVRFERVNGKVIEVSSKKK